MRELKCRLWATELVLGDEPLTGLRRLMQMLPGLMLGQAYIRGDIRNMFSWVILMVGGVVEPDDLGDLF